jgi:hypothetical protein
MLTQAAFFSISDISNVSIDVNFELFSPWIVTDLDTVTGFVSPDGLFLTFSDFWASNVSKSLYFGCLHPDCTSGEVVVRDGAPPTSNTFFYTPASALSQFVATAQISVVPLPAGGLLLLSGLGGIAAFKRRKKRAA